MAVAARARDYPARESLGPAGAIPRIATLPPQPNVNRLEMMPTRQSFAGFQLARKG